VIFEKKHIEDSFSIAMDLVERSKRIIILFNSTWLRILCFFSAITNEITLACTELFPCFSSLHMYVSPFHIDWIALDVSSKIYFYIKDNLFVLYFTVLQLYSIRSFSSWLLESYLSWLLL
jgi:hypothetical protein